LILDRYIARLVALPTLFGFSLLILLLTAFNAATLLRDAAFARIPADQVLTMILLRDVTAAEVLLPTALYFGVLTTMNQWHREREAFVLYGAGVDPSRVSRPVWLVALTISALVALLSLYARPWAYGESYRLDTDASQLTTAAMQPDTFYSFDQATVLGAREIDRTSDQMVDVFMENRLTVGVRIVHARFGRILPAGGELAQRIELEHGVSQWIAGKTLGDRQSTFERLIYFAPAQSASSVNNQRRALATSVIAIADKPKEIAEFQWRVTLPVTAFFMTLIAMELARALPGSSPYPRLVLGLVIYAALFNLAAVARTWVENDRLPTMPGMLWVPAVAALGYLTVRAMPALSLRRPR
jgi:lipopolysaccharide export system permease protein